MTRVSGTTISRPLASSAQPACRITEASSAMMTPRPATMPLPPKSRFMRRRLSFMYRCSASKSRAVSSLPG